MPDHKVLDFLRLDLFFSIIPVGAKMSACAKHKHRVKKDKKMIDPKSSITFNVFFTKRV